MREPLNALREALVGFLFLAKRGDLSDMHDARDEQMLNEAAKPLLERWLGGLCGGFGFQMWRYQL